MADAKEVTTGVRRSLGGVYRAAIGTTLPTDADSNLAADFKDMGYISEDGITKSRSYETQELKEWGGTTVHVVQTSKEVTMAFKDISTLNLDVIKAVYGSGNVSGSIATGLAVQEGDDEPEEAIWVIDEVCLDGTLERTVIPRGKISELGDEVHKKDEAVGYDITLTCLPDSSGVKVYTYYDEAES